MPKHTPHPCLPIFIAATAGIADKRKYANQWPIVKENFTIQSIGYDAASTLSMIKVFRKAKGRLPVPAFSINRYLKSLPKGVQYPSNLSNSFLEACTHFILTGVWHGATFMSGKFAESDITKLQDFFDQDCYEESLEEAGICLPDNISAFKHYVRAGCSLSLMPRRDYCEYSYLMRYPDIALAIANGKIRNGIMHYIQIGASEKRNANRFNFNSYISLFYPGLSEANPQGSQQVLSNFMRLNRDLPYALADPNEFSLLLCLHTIDSEVKFGGMSALYRIVDSILHKFTINHIDLILTDQPAGIPNALHQIQKPTHPLNKWQHKIRLHCLVETYSGSYHYSCGTLPTIGKSTIAIAYNAKAAYILNKYKITGKISGFKWLYLIQEDESTFFAGGSMSALVRHTYSLDFHPIFNSKIIKKYFHKKYPEISSRVGVSFSHQYILPERQVSEREKQNIVLCYMRPEKHADRNCHEIITISLIETLKCCPEMCSWVFIGIGALSEYTIQLSPGIEMRCLSKLDYSKYSHLLSAAKIGISLMDAPHPSVVPFEMAGHGITTITNIHESRKEADILDTIDMGNNMGKILTCRLDPIDLSDKIICAVNEWKSKSPTDASTIQPCTDSLENRWREELKSVMTMIQDVYSLPASNSVDL